VTQDLSFRPTGGRPVHPLSEGAKSLTPPGPINGAIGISIDVNFHSSANVSFRGAALKLAQARRASAVGADACFSPSAG